MDTTRLEQRLVQHWQQAAEDLAIRVTAPVELQDAFGQHFTCEAFAHDFGSPTGAVVISQKTERRLRTSIGSVLEQRWVSRSAKRLTTYNRQHFINELLDWGWFGEAAAEPRWYSERVPRPG